MAMTTASSDFDRAVVLRVIDRPLRGASGNFVNPFD